MPLFVKILIVIGLIGIYILVYLLNHKTKLPKGITLDDLEKCNSCCNPDCENKGKQKNCEDYQTNEK